MNKMKLVLLPVVLMLLGSCNSQPASTTVAVTGITTTAAEQNFSLTVGDRHQLVYTITPANATNKEVTFTPDNSGVVSVENGYAVAVTPGTGHIIATTVDGGYKLDYTVTVTPKPVAVTGISTTEAEKTLNLKVGDTHTLVYTIAPENATNKNVTFTPDNSGVVSVTNGVVKAEKAGTGKVSAITEDGGFTLEYTINVSKDPVIKDIVEGTADTAVSNPGTYFYWSTQSPEEKAKNVMKDTDGNLSLKFKYAYTDSWGAGFQLFYKDSSLTSGEVYEQTFTLKTNHGLGVRTRAIENPLVPYEAGTHQFKTVFIAGQGPDWAPIGCTFYLAFSAVDGADYEIEITDIKTTVSKDLLAPSSVTVSKKDATYVTYIAPVQHATSYEGQVLNNSTGAVIEGFSSVEVTNDAALPNVANLPDGDYVLQVRAKADGYTTSPWSPKSNIFTIGEAAHDPFEIYTAGETKIFANEDNYDGEKAAVANPGKLVVWNDRGWCGSSTTLGTHEMVNGVITLGYTVNSGVCTFAVQLFFENPYATTGHKYKLELNAKSVATGAFQVNGADKSFTEANTYQKFEVEYEEAAGDTGASFEFVIPSTLVSGGTNTINIKDIVWTEVTE